MADRDIGDAANLAAEPRPMTLSVVIQMAGLHKPGRPDQAVTEPLEDLAEQWCGYFVTQLQRLNEPRGGDLLCVVQVQRGDNRASHQYREGRYLPADREAVPDGQ